MGATWWKALHRRGRPPSTGRRRASPGLRISQTGGRCGPRTARSHRGAPRPSRALTPTNPPRRPLPGPGAPRPGRHRGGRAGVRAASGPGRAGRARCRPASRADRRPARGSGPPGSRRPRRPVRAGQAADLLVEDAVHVIGHPARRGRRPRLSRSSTACRRSWSRATRRAAAIGRGWPRRNATPCSQSRPNPRSPIDRARLASTRNVAWNASSASCRSPEHRRQTRSTIGP